MPNELRLNHYMMMSNIWNVHMKVKPSHCNAANDWSERHNDRWLCRMSGSQINIKLQCWTSCSQIVKCRFLTDRDQNIKIMQDKTARNQIRITITLIADEFLDLCNSHFAMTANLVNKNIKVNSTITIL